LLLLFFCTLVSVFYYCFTSKNNISVPICAEDTPKGPQLKTTITPTNQPTLTTTTTFPPVSWSKGQKEEKTFGPTGFPTTVATKNPPADPTEGPIAVGETEDTFGPKDKKKKKNQ